MTLSASDLSISPLALEALLWVRDELASGRLKHVAHDAKVGGFNMNVWGLSSTCDTPHCIGGWINQYLRSHNSDEDIQDSCHWDVDAEDAPPVHILFYPFHTEDLDDLPIKYSTITPTQAVRAIDNFLRTGQPNWRSAILEDLA